MADTVELASTVLSVGISTQNLGKDLLATIKGLGGQVSGVGRTAGTQYRQGFEQASKGAAAGAIADQKKLEAAVAAAAKKIKASRDAEADATRRAAIEEAKLQELRDSGKAKTSQLLAAEDRLTKAKRNQAVATDRVAADTRSLVGAQKSLKDSLAQTEAAASKAGGAAKTLGQRLKDSVTGHVKNPFTQLKSQAETAGTQAATGIQSKLSSGMSGLGSSLKLGLIGAAAAAGAAVGKVFSDSIADASRAQQSKGGVAAVFKGDAAKIEASAKTAATSLGLSQNAYRDLATTLGAGLKNKGLADYTEQTQTLIGVGANLAAQFGGSTKDAVDALASAMRGESDPIEKYGISLSESAVNAELAARGQDKLKGSALEQAKAQARVSLIMRQSADAQGAFGRESDTLAGKQQRSAAQWEDISTKIGDIFLPMLTSVMGFVSDTVMPGIDGMVSSLQGFGQWFTDNQGVIIPVLSGIAAVLLVATGPAVIAGLVALTASTWGAVTAAWAWAAALLANPMTWIVIGIGLVIAGLVALVMNWDAVVAWVSQVWGGFVGWLGGVWDAIVAGMTGFGASFMAGVQGVWNSLITATTTAWNAVTATFTGAWTWVTTTFTGMWNGLTAILQAPVDSAKGAIDTALGLIKGAFEGAVSFISDTWGKLKAAFSGPVKWIADNVVNPLLKAVRSVLNAFGLGSLAGKIPDWNFSGFAGGGYTGRGGKYEPAGIVHRGEVVFSQEDVAAHGGVAATEALRKRRVPGYAMGGAVGGLNPAFRGRLNAWNPAVGNRYRVSVGYRDPATQARLYHLYVTGQRKIKAAPPGKSMHQFGLAADLSPSTSAAHRAIGRRYGLYWPMSYEPWHVQPIGIGKSAGGGGGGSWDPMALFKDAIGGLLSKAKEDHGGGIFGDAIGAIPGIIVNGVTEMASGLFDSGGWLQPGTTLATNLTGQPEAILTAPQWDIAANAIEAVAASGGSYDDMVAAFREALNHAEMSAWFGNIDELARSVEARVTLKAGRNTRRPR